MASEKDQKEKPVLTKLKVKGFKCFRDETEIEIRPLTILAGANSSGKSSIMQPLLLMKQTFFSNIAPSDALDINGPDVQLNKKEMHFKTTKQNNTSNKNSLIFSFSSNLNITLEYLFEIGVWGLKIKKLSLNDNEILYDLNGKIKMLSKNFSPEISKVLKNIDAFNTEKSFSYLSPLNHFLPNALKCMHLKGNRDEPKRSFSKESSTHTYQGLFHEYYPSVLNDWFEKKNENYNNFEQMVKNLNLADEIRVECIENTMIKISIRDKISGSNNDHINLADVGFGLSQVFPVIVALLHAEPGQIVYIEQPELHLHPRAQFDLAKALVDAANRGVIVVAETHSDQLILGIQHQIAGDGIDNWKAKMHWFWRDDEGASHVDSTDIDESGSWKKDWKQDFDDVYMSSQQKYIKKSFEKKKKMKEKHATTI